MKVAIQIGLKAQNRCIKTTVIGITTNICVFLYFFKPHMAASRGQFPANFRFSGALFTTPIVLTEIHGIESVNHTRTRGPNVAHMQDLF